MDADFNKFWHHYPKKKAKGQAIKTWNKLKKNDSLPDIGIMVKAITDQRAEKKFLKYQNKFVPEWKYPSTWLNGYCWEDDVELPETIEKRLKKGNGDGVQNMFRAYNILKNLGEEKFNQFCFELKMPDEDRQSVLDKYNNVYPDVRVLAQGCTKAI